MISHRSLFTCFILLFVIIESSGELKFVEVLFRHTNRAPIQGFEAKYYPNNPHTEKDWAPLKGGELTEKGKNDAFELGKYFKELYGSWLDVDNRNDTVEFHADIVDRIIISAQLTASGLFSAPFDNRFNATRSWESIPVHSISEEEEWLYETEAFCRNFKKLLAEAEKTPAVAKYLEENKDFYEMVAQKSGYKGKAYYIMAFIIYVMLSAEADVGLAPPKWAETIFPHGKLEEAAGMQHYIFGSTDELKQIGGGVWVRKWLNDIDDFIANENQTTKAKFYSGHDMNLGSILVALDAFDEPHVPEYNSAVMFELHEIDRQHFIKVVYKRVNDTKPVVIFNCGKILCPLETVKHLAANILSGDPRKACDPISA